MTLPIPDFFNENSVKDIWNVKYNELYPIARDWAKEYNIKPAKDDKQRTCFILIDIQNTFCVPSGELYVGGKSGMGAVEDNIRLCKYIYKNLSDITDFVVSLDSHKNISIFHEIFWVNQQDEHPEPSTIITYNDIKNGIWLINPNICSILGISYDDLQNYALDYTSELEKRNKFNLSIWPYHGMIGGIGHALVSSVEESIFFHNIARETMMDIQLKGSNPITESFSIFGAEFKNKLNKEKKNSRLIRYLLNFDKIIITGQAKSHCVAWTIQDLLTDILEINPQLAKKLFILEDCTTPIVIDNVIDFTDIANETFKSFEEKGINLITTDIQIGEL